uniref:Fe2OG dioxygenase domain-containing protein n=1 Tax=Bionectria ochroleuca TaxID=29856 RepID=A0A8H7NNG9_BIOOC
MTINLGDLDAHEQPSDELRAEWKSLPLSETGFVSAGSISKNQLTEAFKQLGLSQEVQEDAQIIHHPLLPGLLILPNLVPENVQQKLLELMIHRDLSNPNHQTNMHLHFKVPYESLDPGASFFSHGPDSPPPPSTPRTPPSTGPSPSARFSTASFTGSPWAATPRFPADIAGFLQALFPETQAQAAIVNFYTPGDTMMMHRDVSEESDRGLVSLSLGCDGIFMIAPSKGPQDEGEKEDASAAELPRGRYLTIPLRSGDAIYMTKESRYAWHGVPKVIKGTCPAHLENFPATEDGQYEEWRGWMKNKRVNLNVRQIK